MIMNLRTHLTMVSSSLVQSRLFVYLGHCKNQKENVDQKKEKLYGCCVFWPANGCSVRHLLVEISFSIQKLIATSEQNAEHLFAGRNTQHMVQLQIQWKCTSYGVNFKRYRQSLVKTNYIL